MGSPRLALVGAFVIGGLLLFAVGLFMIGDRRLLFSEQFEIEADFGNVAGVEISTAVRLSGMPAGEVIGIEIPDAPGGRFVVRMRVREDLHALVSETSSEKSEYFKLVSLKAHSETGEIPSAQVTLLVDGEERKAESNGGGTVDATFCAIETIVASQAQLQLYSVNNITTGTDAQGEVTVRLQKSGRIVNGHGADTDIIMASAKAYLHALNKLVVPETRAHPQHDV